MGKTKIASFGNRTLTDIFVGELMSQSHALWLMLDGFAVHDSELELLNNRLVD